MSFPVNSFRFRPGQGVAQAVQNGGLAHSVLPDKRRQMGHVDFMASLKTAEVDECQVVNFHLDPSFEIKTTFPVPAYASVLMFPPSPGRSIKSSTSTVVRMWCFP